MWTTTPVPVETSVGLLFMGDSFPPLWKKPFFHGSCPHVFNTWNQLPRIPGTLLFHKSTSIIVMTIL
jgi:hypothetical protein